MGWKCSPTMWSAESGSRWWMSETRPAREFSSGIIARWARPSSTARTAWSMVAQRSRASSG